MLGNIYIIRNKINNKVYIGQTVQSIKIRFTNHIMASRIEDTKFYRAIRKHGEKNFYIELLEEVPLEKLDEREIYWIKEFDSYNNGYNSTLGGQGVTCLDYEKIKELWDLSFSVKEIAEKLSIGRDTVSRVLKNQFKVSQEIILDRGYKKQARSLTDDFIITKWQEGLTPNQICKKYGSTLKTIHLVLNNFGITEEQIKDRANENQRAIKREEVLRLWTEEKLCISEIVKLTGSKNTTIKKQLLELGFAQKDIDDRKREKVNRNAIPVYQYDLEGNYLASFTSALAAGKALGKSSGVSISGCCHHKEKYKTAYGYRWEFYKQEKI